MLKTIIITVSFIVQCLSFLPFELDKDNVEPTYENFKLWQETFDIHFGDVERESRFRIWKTTVNENNIWNKENHSWKRGINQFTHLTFREFKELRLMAPQECSATAHNMKQKPYTIDSANTPEKIDWREKKVISEVKDQGNCGSCYTFSTTGCLESHRAIFNSSESNFMVELSEQQLVECSGNFNNFGCNGGLPSQVFEYIKYNGGINTEFSYPYKAGNGIVDKCSYDGKTGWKFGASVDDVYNVTQYDEDDMVTQVGNVGPLSVCFDVVSGFSQYKSGVYTSNICGTNSTSVNHAVLAVGYGTQEGPNGLPYWTVKNSWGYTWGNQGYFLIKRGSNECGISTCASYPILKATKNRFA